MPSLDSFTYHGKFTLEKEEGLKHIYDLDDDVLLSKDFDESEILFFKFKDTFGKYSASREMARELMYFVNDI